jgi:hypothetical protein
MNDTEGLCSRWSPEASRDLEFDLRHAHLALGFVVCEGNLRIPSEAQDHVGSVLQSPQEVDGVGLEGGSGVGIRRIWRIEFPSLAEFCLVARAKVLAL